ncbi:AH receptor-interacting protein [Orchesella cincta]|uniref:AH receptor-interacting protein n=1 Tax=Orchesella cincta TaxID=48709 RepID=A0A1D2NAT6_ORCCI|nr:AH receptor-interacting protein [Orchesella cincta]
MPGTESHRRQDEGEVDISSLRIASSEGKTTPVSNAAPLSQGTNKGQQDLPSPVKKIVLQPGTTVAELPYPNGTRISFHFETVATDDGTVYDDTRKHPKPMELIIVTEEGAAADTWQMGRDILIWTVLYKPKDLTFTFEILDINLPGQYEKEAWYMTDEEKVESIPELKAAGNKLFQTIRHCTSALEIEPGNVKALFRRGQGHKCVGNWDEARDDFDKALSLDPTLRKAVKEQLVEVAALEKKADEALKVAMKKMF